MPRRLRRATNAIVEALERREMYSVSPNDLGGQPADGFALEGSFAPPEAPLAPAEASRSLASPIIPLYQFPLSAPGLLSDWWRQAIEGATSDTPLTIVVNPQSGPIEPSHPNFDYWISALSLVRANPNIHLIGYVSTRVNPTMDIPRTPEDILAKVHLYETQFKDPGTGRSFIDGIFLDEMSNSQQNVGVFQTVAEGIRTATGLAGSLIVGNPGTPVPEVYLERNVADVFIVREGTPANLVASPVPSYLGASQFAHLGFAAIIHSAAGISSMNDVLRLAKLQGYDSYFVTDDNANNPYDAAPTYFREYLEQIHAPYIASESHIVRENRPPGAVITTVVAGDPDSGQTINFSIVGGNTGNAFQIDGSGRITVNESSALDFEVNPLFQLRVRATDNSAQPLFDEATVIVQLNDVVVGGDINNDEQVNLVDFAILRANFGKMLNGRTLGDLDGDGRVNLSDFAILRANFGRMQID